MHKARPHSWFLGKGRRAREGGQEAGAEKEHASHHCRWLRTAPTGNDRAKHNPASRKRPGSAAHHEGQPFSVQHLFLPAAGVPEAESYLCHLCKMLIQTTITRQCQHHQVEAFQGSQRASPGHLLLTQGLCRYQAWVHIIPTPALSPTKALSWVQQCPPVL